MKVLKAWVQALGINQGTFSAWLKEAPKHGNLTFWCLERGLLRSSDYFTWAMNHYGLAMIRQDYFNLPANRELWAKIQSVANWGPEMLPLEEWDGTVFIACVEPAEDIQWSFPVQYVLATTRDLHTQWERLNSEATRISTSQPHFQTPVATAKHKVATQAPPAMPTPAAVVAPPPPVPAAVKPQGPPISAPTIPQETPEVAQATQASINLMPTAMFLPEDEKPMGMMSIEDAPTAPKIPMPNLNQPVLQAPEDLPPPPEVSYSPSSPIVTAEEPAFAPPVEAKIPALNIPKASTPLVLQDDSDVVAAEAPVHSEESLIIDDAPIGLSLDEKPKANGFKLNLGTATNVDVAPTTQPQVPVAPAPTPAPTPIAPVAISVEAEPVVAPARRQSPPLRQPILDSNVEHAPLNQTGTGSVTNLAVPVATTASFKTNHGHGSINSDEIAPTSLAGASTEVEAIAFVFQQLKQNFKFSWLFFIHGDQLIPYCWDSAVTPTGPTAAEPLDLKQPSLFRIVMRTRMPYHGHVVESPINTGFFRAWGLRNTPSHVTAIPLSSGGHTIALLLCAGEKPAQQDQTLRFTEKMGVSILSSLGKKQAA